MYVAPLGVRRNVGLAPEHTQHGNGGDAKGWNWKNVFVTAILRGCCCSYSHVDEIKSAVTGQAPVTLKWKNIPG